MCINQHSTLDHMLLQSRTCVKMLRAWMVGSRSFDQILRFELFCEYNYAFIFNIESFVISSVLIGFSHIIMESLYMLFYWLILIKVNNYICYLQRYENGMSIRKSRIESMLMMNVSHHLRVDLMAWLFVYSQGHLNQFGGLLLRNNLFQIKFWGHIPNF